MSKVWVYCAVSSAKQGDTIDEQRAWARETAALNGWQVAREFHGVSTGKDGIRALLTELLTELRAVPKSARPERVLMIRLDRLGRGAALDVIGALGEIYKLGTTIHTRQDGDLRLDDVASAVRPIFDILAGAFENADRRDKSRAMHARKRAAGEVQGLPPYGFIAVDKRLHPYEPEAAFIRELFERRARGWSYSKLSAFARTEAPGKRLKNGELRAVRWATTTLTKILANPEYREAIVPAVLFDEVVGMRRAPIARQDAKNPWPLRGAVRCVCGLAMTGRSSGSGKWRQRYYVCADVAAHGGYPGHNAIEVERQFGDLLGKLVADPALIATYKDRRIDVAALQRRKAKLMRDRETLAARRTRVWELLEDERFPKDEVVARLEELRAKAQQADETIGAVEREIVRAESAARMWSGAHEALRIAAGLWFEADVPLQQEIAQAVSALVGGLWLDPEQQHRLLISAAHGKSVHKADDGITKKFIESITQ